MVKIEIYSIDDRYSERLLDVREFASYDAAKYHCNKNHGTISWQNQYGYDVNHELIIEIKIRQSFTVDTFIRNANIKHSINPAFSVTETGLIQYYDDRSGVAVINPYISTCGRFPSIPKDYGIDDETARAMITYNKAIASINPDIEEETRLTLYDG